MKYRALLFDFDYTLADSGDSIVFCFNQALRDMGQAEVSEREIKALIGAPLADMYVQLAPAGHRSTSERFVSRYRAVADRHMNSMVTLYPGVTDLLDWCGDHRIATGIVTTKAGQRVASILEHQGLAGKIDLILGSEHVQYPKPDPEGLKKALAHFELQTHEALYVGDNPVDAGAAAAAEVDFIAVRSGAASDWSRQEYRCVAVLDGISQLQAFLHG